MITMKKIDEREVFYQVETKLIKRKRFGPFAERITGPSDVGNFLQKLIAYKDREWFCAIGLDMKGYANYMEVIHIGTLNQALIHPREVFKSAIISNCNSIIIAHNHPSGDPEPSQADRLATKSMMEAGRMLGIEVIDHLIVSDLNYYSIKENKTYYERKK